MTEQTTEPAVAQTPGHVPAEASPLRMSETAQVDAEVLKAALSCAGEYDLRVRNPGMLQFPALAQVGWIGQTGGIYGLKDAPQADREPGGYAPLYLQVGTWVRDAEFGTWSVRD